MRPSIRSSPLAGLAIVLLAMALALAACGGQQEKAADQEGAAPTVRVVVSLAIFADFVRQVGGDKVDVFPIIPAGADPHTFEPSPKTAQEISEADIVFINGRGLEAQLKDLVEENVRQGVFVIPLTSSGPEWEPQDGEPAWVVNPHQWLDMSRAMFYVEVVAAALRVLDPANANHYAANEEAYVAELTALDQEVETKLSAIPSERRKLVTFHDSFRVFAHRYGLDVVAVVVPSPGQEPSARDAADLVEAIRQHKVPAVFREPQFNARILELAAADAGVEVCTLHSASFPGDIESYVDMMRFNAQELVRCLGAEGD